MIDRTFTDEKTFKESFKQFFYYVNVSLPGVKLSTWQIGNIEKLRYSVPFSFYLFLRTGQDPRSSAAIANQDPWEVITDDPATYNGDWSVRIHDYMNETVDAVGFGDRRGFGDLF